MDFHTPSIYVTMVLVYAVLIVLQVFVMRLRSGGRVMNFWLVGTILGFIGHLLVLGRGQLPHALSVSLANTLFLVSWSATWAGIRYFNNQTTTSLALWVPGFLVGLCFQFFDPIGQNADNRIVMYTVVFVGMMAFTLRDSLHAQKVEPLLMRRLLIYVIVSLMLFMSIRGGLMVGVNGANLILATNNVSVSTLLFTIATVIVINMANILMLQERLENTLIGAARTDPLTTLFNRAGFREQAGPRLQRAQSEASSSAILMMDLDRFKQINDSYGHEVGDRFLQLFAKSARNSLRPTDLLARHGGEEFCALLTGVDASVAAQIADRVRSHFEAEVLEVNGARISATVSIGVADITASGSDVQSALNRADKALYVAKQQGRNQVQFAQ